MEDTNTSPVPISDSAQPVAPPQVADSGVIPPVIDPTAHVNEVSDTPSASGPGVAIQDTPAEPVVLPSTIIEPTVVATPSEPSVPEMTSASPDSLQEPAMPSISPEPPIDPTIPAPIPNDDPTATGL